MYHRIVLLLALLTCSTFSQEVEVQTELLTIALDEGVDDLHFFDGKAIVPFSANLTGFSQPFPYKGPRKLILRATIDEFSAGPPLPVPVAAVDLPPNANRVLLCCLKSQDGPLRIIAYNISSTGSQAGDYRFFNFSSKPLSVILGEQSFALQSKGDRIVTDSAWRDEVLDLPMRVASMEENKPRLAYSSVWGHRPGRRNFVFMSDGGHPSKPIAISRFFDIPSTEKKAGP